MIFENINRDCVIALQYLPGVGTKRLHTTLHVGPPGDRVGFEVESSLRQDAEKHPVMIQPIGAEHATAVHLPQELELIEDKVAEGFVIHKGTYLTLH
jgi:hypothetical protein